MPTTPPRAATRNCWPRSPPRDATDRIGTPSPRFPIRDHTPSGRTPFVTVALIVATTRVFLATLPHFGSAADLHRFDADWALIPARVTTGNGGGTVFTLMLLHASLLHLVGNMLFLWTFGDTIENAFGPFGFLAVSLLCGLAAAAQAAGDPGSTLPMVGASGAIAGVMGACLLLFPRHPRDAAFR